MNINGWQIFLWDCIELMKNIPDKSIDMILCDLPYGQTARNKWDKVIPFDKMWEWYERIIKDNWAIVLFANGMFTAQLMMSNSKLWRYNLVWDKVIPSWFLNAKKMPLRSHEDICVFYKKQPIYNPQMTIWEKCHSVGKAKWISQEIHSRNTNYWEFKKLNTEWNLKYPKSILTYSKPHSSTAMHPTQKSEKLFETLIKTYSNEWDIIYDWCAWSWTTWISARNTGRKFILHENNLKIFEILKNRLS